MSHKQTPTLLHFLLIGRSLWITICGTAVCFLVIYVYNTYSIIDRQSTFLDILFYLFGMAIAAAIGAFFGSIFLWPWVSAMAAELNRAPFEIEDFIVVLNGPHRGREAKIYEVWDSHLAVRVDLGPQEKENAKDIFRYFEVYRVGGECRPTFQYRRQKRQRIARQK